MIASLRADRHPSKDSWTLEDRATGAFVRCWSLTECLTLIALLVTPPAPGEERFLVLDAVTNESGEDCVLYDLVTGRAWKRKRDGNLQLSIDVLREIAGSGMLPPEYSERQPVSYAPAF